MINIESNHEDDTIFGTHDKFVSISAFTYLKAIETDENFTSKCPKNLTQILN